MLDLDAMEAKAKAAKDSRPETWAYDPNGEDISAGAVPVADSWDDNCGRFIAAANPTAVLDLIRELRAAQAAVVAEREACADLIQGWNTAMTDKLAAEIRARGAKGGE